MYKVDLALDDLEVDMPLNQTKQSQQQLLIVNLWSMLMVRCSHRRKTDCHQ